MNILEVKNLNKTYENGVTALKQISFHVDEGEFLGVIGLSGSGKSTLLRCLNRLVEPSSGEIFINGEEIIGMNLKQLRLKRREVGMIFQHFNLINRKSVLSNVLSGALGRCSTIKSVVGIFSKEDIELAYSYLDIVGLRGKAHIRADELSGGQKQRVAIARCLMQKPKIILADEPVASLDPATSHTVLEYLAKVNKDLGITILCNLHFLSLVREYTNRVIALKAGEIVYEGDSRQINDQWFTQIYGDGAREVEIR